MKVFLRFLLVFVVLFILVAGGAMMYLGRGLDAGATVSLESIDLQSLEDGLYRGRYEAGRWTNEVEVKVEGHRIVEINLVDDVTFSKPELFPDLAQKVIEAQSIDVDIVAGSTVTGKAYLKAIENALKVQ